jgi:hypothetical protein
VCARGAEWYAPVYAFAGGRDLLHLGNGVLVLLKGPGAQKLASTAHSIMFLLSSSSACAPECTMRFAIHARCVYSKREELPRKVMFIGP